MLCGSVIKEDITLIPKVEGTDQVNDFRPISLVHSFAKLVSCH
jgi:hypothetical protein